MTQLLVKLQSLPLTTIITFALCAYLGISTGIHSDDYPNAQFWLANNLDFNDISPKHWGYLPWYVMHSYIFKSLGYDSLGYEWMRILINFLAVLVLADFFKKYTDRLSSLLIGLLIVFYPTHDATTYWFTGSYMTHTCLYLFFGYNLLQRERMVLGFLVSLFGSFFSYSSPPMAAGLMVLMFLEKQWKKLVVFSVAQSLYILYFLSLPGERKGTGQLVSDTITRLFKALFMQAGTFVDANVGPSFWLKLYTSILSLDWFSLLIALGLCWCLYLHWFKQGKKIIWNKGLLLSLCVITVASLGIYAITGRYPQIVFGLGNRTTFFASFLFAYLLIVLASKHRILFFIIIPLMSFSILGLSSHWKSWNKKQTAIMMQMKQNSELQKFDFGKMIYLKNNLFSSLHGFAHIQFTAENISSLILRLALNLESNPPALALDRRYRVEGNILRDTKYDFTHELSEEIPIYDTELDRFYYVRKDDFQSEIDKLPIEVRHWVQLAQGSFFEKLILKISPRLKYLFL